MVDYLLRSFEGSGKVSVLSRGYGRKTKGFRWVNEHSGASEVGDEILMIRRKHKDLLAAVDEKRNRGAKKIIEKGGEILVLDDAYQHRYIQRDVNLLLSDFNRPFFDDFMLPAGRLRESRKAAQRSDAVILSNSPDDLSKPQADIITQKVQKYSKKGSPVFFSGISVKEPLPLFETSGSISKDLILVSGIANPENFEISASKHGNVIKHFSFHDHKAYSMGDLSEAFRIADSSGASVLTTEKDAIKLKEIQELEDKPIFFLPIEARFLDFGTNFDSWLKSLIPSMSN